MLTGTGGIGKTNLCLKVGQHLLGQFPDGVWLVELAPIADPTLIPKAVANVLGVRESADRFAATAQIFEGHPVADLPISEKLLNFLRQQNCLLILIAL